MGESKVNKEIASVAKTLFYGEFEENVAFPFPRFNDEQKEMGTAMTDAVNKFASEKIDSEKFDREALLPKEVLSGIGQLGLFGLAVSEDLGGLELDHSLYARVFSEVAGIDGSIATTLGAHQSIGYKALLNEGTDEQKKKWLPALASGEKLAAFCLTEPGSGSDAYSIKTKAVDNGDGTFTLNGQKLWITNGGSAEFYTVFCKTDHEINGEKKEKISCLAVEKSMEGISFGEKEDKMGIRASETRAVYFDNVIVPKENIIGEAGKGFKIAMNVLNTGRLSLGSGCVGGMKSSLELACAHAKGRKQFGNSISEYGLIQSKLAKMSSNIYSCESMVYFSTGLIDKGMEDYSMESAICKVYCSEKLWETVDMALQVAAGNGYMREYPYERIMRDSRINLIFEGTNEILRIFIALTGLKGPSDSLKELGKISDVSKFLQDPIKSLGIASNFIKGRTSKMIGQRTITDIDESLKSYSKEFARMLSEFAICVENTIIKHGKNIIGNEFPQERIANMAIELYVQLCVLSRTDSIIKDDSIEQKDKDYALNLTRLSCIDSKQAFHRNRRRLDGKYDSCVPKASEDVCSRNGYGLDILKF